MGCDPNRPSSNAVRITVFDTCSASISYAGFLNSTDILELERAARGCYIL
jgi:hypothetical protein